MKGIPLKTRIQCWLVIRLSLVTVLASSIAITQWVLVSRASAAAAFNVRTKPSATYLPDDIDELVQAARNGITTLNASNNNGINEVSSALDNFAAAVAGLDNSATLAALVAQIKATVQQIEALRISINALRNQIESLSLAQKVAELKAKAEALEQCTAIKRAVGEEYAKLIKQLQARITEAEAKNQSTASLKQELSLLQTKRDEELKKLEASCAKILSEIEKLEDQVEKTAKARKVLEKLSGDRAKASQFVQLIRTNNRTGLSEFLQREAGGGDFVISDAKTGTGPLVIFRVDTLSHCLSGGAQCSGKLYSVSN